MDVRRDLTPADVDGDGLDEGDHQGDLLATPAETEADEHREEGPDQADGDDRLLADADGDAPTHGL